MMRRVEHRADDVLVAPSLHILRHIVLSALVVAQPINPSVVRNESLFSVADTHGAVVDVVLGCGFIVNLLEHKIIQDVLILNVSVSPVRYIALHLEVVLILLILRSRYADFEIFSRCRHLVKLHLDKHLLVPKIVVILVLYGIFFVA